MSRRLLTQRQQQVLLAVLFLGVLLLADTLYLVANRLADWLDLSYFAGGETSLPKFYQVLVLGHTVVGLLFVAVAIGFAGWHLRTLWDWRLGDRAVWRKRFGNERLRRGIISGTLVVLLGLVLAVSGLFIVTEANSRDNAWAFALHVAAALAIPGIYLVHRLASRWKPSAASYRLIPGSIVALTLLAIVLHGLSYQGDDLTQAAQAARAEEQHPGAGSHVRAAAAPVNASGFIPAHAVPESSPFFPSPTTTTTGRFLPFRLLTRGSRIDMGRLQADLDTFGFAVNERIGAAACVTCHADIVEQWARSAHRFSSFNNPFYTATITLMRDSSLTPNERINRHVQLVSSARNGVGKIKSKWCSGCHDPALMMTGEMDEEIDPASPQAQTGLACMSCHAIDKIHNVTGNGNYNIQDEREDPYLFASAQAGVGKLLHDLSLKAKPTVHKREMLKPFFRTSEYCGTCHKVSLDAAVNNYRWLRGQNEYDAWHDSGVARNAARTFYLPEKARTCQDCHMPLEKAVHGDVAAKGGYVRSHRFLAANTALPYLRQDEETIRRTEAFLQEEKLTVDILALRQGELGAPVYAPERNPQALVPGKLLSISIVVRNKGVGHTFPGGTNDSNEGWLEVSVLDEAGRTLAVSGAVQADGHVDPAAHFYRAVIVDRQGNKIQRRNAQDIFAPVYVRTIGPGTADVGHYQVEVPRGLEGKALTIKARLLWRKFDRAYTEFAFRYNPQGFRSFDDVPDLPITVIASDEVTVPVSAFAPRGAPVVLEAEDWMRLNDYGIGLLLQGDTRGATEAFAKVVEVAPQRLDGHRNLARAALQDGSLTKAYEHLRRCEELQPGHAQTAWVWGQVLQQDGRYPEAAAAYRRVLQDFPADRATLRSLGRVYYLNAQFEEALELLGRVLEIDPEDRVAHYHRMLVLRALGRHREAGQAEAAYEVYQIDESAQEVTRAYRLKHPYDNESSQPIQVHVLKPTPANP